MCVWTKLYNGNCSIKLWTQSSVREISSKLHEHVLMLLHNTPQWKSSQTSPNFKLERGNQGAVQGHKAGKWPQFNLTSLSFCFLPPASAEKSDFCGRNYERTLFPLKIYMTYFSQIYCLETISLNLRKKCITCKFPNMYQKLWKRAWSLTQSCHFSELIQRRSKPWCRFISDVHSVSPKGGKILQKLKEQKRGAVWEGVWYTPKMKWYPIKKIKSYIVFTVPEHSPGTSKQEEEKQNSYLPNC